MLEIESLLMANETKRKGLVNGKTLLERLWDASSRPSIYWLREHTGKDVPAVKIGRLYWYDEDKVRAAIGV